MVLRYYFDGSAIRRESMREDVLIVAIKTKGRAKGGMGEEMNLLSDPGSELRLGREKEEREKV